jgi:hypothetical protein
MEKSISKVEENQNLGKQVPLLENQVKYYKAS